MAIIGSANFGPFQIRVPGVIDVESVTLPSSETRGPWLGGIDQAGGVGDERILRLRDDRHELTLRLPILAPEITGVAGDAREIAEGVVSIVWPIPEPQWAALIARRPEVIVLANARFLLTEGEPFVRAVTEVRERLGANPLLWAPRVGLPHRLAFLTYLGVDLVDTHESILRGLAGDFLDPTLGAIPRNGVGPNWTCDCSACRQEGEGRLVGHARHAMLRESEFIRTVALDGQLRDLVEARQVAEPLLAEMLRYTDGTLGPLLEERSPVVSRNSVRYVLRESRRRPEVVRFRSRLLERYRPPGSKRVLLLVPCSKTKPYRISRSHRQLAKAWEGVRHSERIHVVSVTSPLGLVPRELEDVFPARHYDIPVTGVWEEDERRAVTEALQRLLGVGAYTRVVVHLDPVEYRFIADRIPASIPCVWTLADSRTTSPAAIDSLRKQLAQALADSSPVQGGVLSVVREELHALASYQFGREAADRLFAPPLRLMGRPWFQRIVDGARTDLATVREERGYFQLTVAGGLRLLGAHPLEVEVAEGLELAGDLFAPGVTRADPAIRVGDAVLLVRKGELLAVGEARLPGRMMTQLRRGLAVAVRHRQHAPTLVPPPTDT